MEKVTLDADTVETLATIGALAQGSPDTSDNGPLADVLASATEAAARRSDASDEAELYSVHVSTLVGYSRDGIREAEKAGRMEDMDSFKKARVEGRAALRENGVWE